MNDREQGRALRHSIERLAQLQINNAITNTDGDINKARQVACEFIAEISAPLNAREWSVGMYTVPGDLVYTPDKKYVTVYSGASPMPHTNPLFFPGAQGVYHWTILPDMLYGYKVWPELSGIIMSIRTGEKWYDSAREKLYQWVVMDNNNCVWSPGTAPNEWKEVGG